VSRLLGIYNAIFLRNGIFLLGAMPSLFNFRSGHARENEGCTTQIRGYRLVGKRPSELHIQGVDGLLAVNLAGRQKWQ
jgi:hypothetical protein